MKRSLVLFLFLVSAPLFAQLNYGVKAGLTSSDQTWEFTPKFARNGQIDSKSTINLGVFAEYSDAKYVSVIAEINYRQKGAKIYLEYTGRDTSGNVVVPKNIDNKIGYLNVTLLGKFRYPLLPFFTPYLCAGLKSDYQISNKFDDEDLGFLATESTKQIMGAVIGGGFEIKDLLPVVLLAEVRYEFDFNNLYVQDNFKFKNKTLEFRLGVRF